jgi:Zn-dependent peptidase ImmA (M78 family)/transcriptional regulator with XRE-family HTH domain
MIKPNNLHSVAYKFNPEFLRIAREYRGLRKNELAVRLGITPSAITQFESGQVKPTPQTVAHLSMALRFPPSFFSQSQVSRLISPDQCHFRSLRSCSQMERRKMVSAGNLIGMVVDFIERSNVNLPDEQISLVTSHGAETTEEIEEAATKLRRDWGLGLGPIDNLLHLLESKGILVFRLLEDCKSLDAFSLWSQRRPFIFLNTEKDSASRARFDAAHELGHLTIHTDYLPGDKEQEDQANRFASAFLLPRETFLQECPRRLVWDHFRELKRRWKVSLAALVRRARDLQVLSDDTYRRANVLIGKYGWKTSEPDEPNPEFPTILPQAMNLLTQSGFSLSGIAESVNISEPDLRWLVYMENREGN